jgi:parallel beta-helix repeat protein
MKRALALGAVFTVLGLTQPAADNGRIPVFAPRVINRPGHYVVTRDISATAGSVVLIRANDVTLDLNGHTLTLPTGTDAIILIDNTLATRGVTIRNGRLVGGINAIVTPFLGHPSQVRLEDLEIANCSGTAVIFFDPESVEITRCHVHDGGAGISAQASSTQFVGRILNNKVERVGSFGILLLGLLSGEVSGNVVTDIGSASVGVAGIQIYGPGVPGTESGAVIVARNVVSTLPGGSDDDGMIILENSPGDLILDNVVTNCGGDGILVRGDQTRVEGNIVSGNGGDGIRIVSAGAGGSWNHLEGNQTQGNGSCGIHFETSGAHVYRNNIVGGNGIVPGLCNGGGTNTNAGGNWCDGVLCP